MKRIFITGTNTGVGKTFVTRGLAAAARQRGLRTAAIKPVETGVDPQPEDAIQLAEACARPELANAPNLYRAPRPLAPYADALMGGATPPTLSALQHATLSAAGEPDLLLVEGAGGPLVPLSPTEDIIGLATLLETNILLVSADRLGTLSATLTAVESIRSRNLNLAAVALVQVDPTTDLSQETNRHILQTRGLPTFPIPHTPNTLTALAQATTPLLTHLLT